MARRTSGRCRNTVLCFDTRQRSFWSRRKSWCSAWVGCVKTAFESEGAADKFDRSLAKDYYDLVGYQQALNLQNPATRIHVLSAAIVYVMRKLFILAGIR